MIQNNIVCTCGHVHKNHKKIYSHNYSAGKCSECNCEHFIIKSIMAQDRKKIEIRRWDMTDRKREVLDRLIYNAQNLAGRSASEERDKSISVLDKIYAEPQKDLNANLAASNFYATIDLKTKPLKK